MTLKMNENRQSNVAVSCSEQPLAARTRMITPGLRRSTHISEDFLAAAILFPENGDVNRNSVAAAGELAGVASEGNAARAVSAEDAVSQPRPDLLNGFRMATALDEEDEDEEDDDDYEDEDLDEEDDEDLDEDDAEFDDEDDLAEEEDDLDDDDLDDDDEKDDEE